MLLQTEYEFLLPKGYVDDTGHLHREGRMRLATAADEILPLRDPRVRDNPEYLIILILSRVIVRLGSLPAVDERAVESLFVGDLSYLQDLYNRINQTENPVYEGRCPECQKAVSIPVNFLTAGR